MESELRPRDIQARIRAGASVDELASHAGMSPAMVERFAAPVLAERAHVAATAMTSTLRRSGEGSAHRTLRLVVSERLAVAGVDLDAVDWDAHRISDGRWAVSAAYRLGEEDRVADFLYQPAGRFSVTANDEARGLTGEKPWPPAGEESPDDEPTVDLADELALVRAVQESERGDADAATDDDDRAAASPGTPVDPQDADEVTGSVAAADSDRADGGSADRGSADGDSADGDRDGDESNVASDGTTDTDQAEEADEPAATDTDTTDTDEPTVGDDSAADHEDGADRGRDVIPIAAPELSEDASSSQLDRLFAMLDHEEPDEDGPSEDTGPIYAGLSDAAAVPDVDAGTLALDEPGDDPMEPSLFDDDPRFATPDRPKRTRRRNRRTKRSARSTAEDAAVAGDSSATGQDVDHTDRGASEASPAHAAPKPTPTESQASSEPDASPEPDPPPSAPRSDTESDTAPDSATGSDSTTGSDSAAPDGAAEPEPPAEPEPATKRPRKRKGRASVPSWDEIMFGSPRRR